MRRNKKFILSLIFTLLIPAFTLAYYDKNSPVFSSYIANYKNSSYFVDEGYHLLYYKDLLPITLENDYAGDIKLGFKLGGMIAYNFEEYFKKPVISDSYPDSFILKASPFKGVNIKVNFSLPSSSSFILELSVENKTELPLSVFYIYENRKQSVCIDDKNNSSLLIKWEQPAKGVYFQQETLKGFLKERLSLYTLSEKFYSFGGFENRIKNLKDIISTDENVLNGSLKCKIKAAAFNYLSKKKKFTLKLYKKTVQSENEKKLFILTDKLKNFNTEKLIKSNKKWLKSFPNLNFISEDEKLLFIYGIYLGIQQFLPGEGQFPYPYYVFSREPKWGWGHEGQVFHESLSMHTIAIIEPSLAMGSQLNFAAVQDKDGYIPYRAGAFFKRTFPVKGEKTTSAPFFSWTNLTIYKTAKESGYKNKNKLNDFLKAAYISGKNFTLYLLKERDKNKNGLLEWGGHTLLECVRDYLNAVFDLLGKDPSTLTQLEALDLSSMVVKEMKSLKEMAKILGYREDVNFWLEKIKKTSYLINRYMWDEKTGFYYHVHKDTMKFLTPSGKSLKRKEIIGFLPLWAGIVPENRKRRLISHLTNKNEFWREFGIPTLSADDPYYNPQVLSCCRWNGPVWITWVYPVFKGLIENGEKEIAEKILLKMEKAMLFQLKRNHRFWESYSPDFTKLYSPKNYIWDTLISRMIYELRK